MKRTGLAVFLFASLALADATSAAKDALKKASLDYEAGSFDRALARLEKARAACDTCSPRLRATLLLHIGVMRARGNDTRGAIASFRAALALDPSLTLPPLYDQPDVREIFVDAHETEAPPGGDFQHKPWREQRAKTPLPIYAEYDGGLTRVVVVYRREGDEEWRRVRLKRVGHGWGGAIPCAQIKLGAIEYFIEGYDEDDRVAASGDRKRPFRTEIKESIEGVTPHLPGRPAPHGCDLGKGCEIEPYACGENEPGETEEGSVSSRLWVGGGVAVGMSVYGGEGGACGDRSTWLCTTPGGADFRAGDLRRAGTIDSGVVTTAIRVLGAVDWAATDNLLLGLRGGYVHGTYSGARVSGPPPNLHLEARAAWVFGDQPLARTGFAPTAMVGLGVTRVDLPVAVDVTLASVPGARTVIAWQTGGPFFVAAGAGLRYAFSPRVAFTMIARFDLALGGASPVGAGDLEGTMQWGF